MSKIYTRAGIPSMVAATLVLSMLTGCGKGGDKPASTSPTGKAEQKEVLPEVKPVSPGPYKTVEIDGVEFRQGRFPQGQYGGVLARNFIGDDPKTYNAWVAADTESAMVAGLMHSGLVMTDPYTGDMVPDMAESLEVKPDKLTYITKLRKGMKWSDGKPITSADVEFTWNTLIAKGYGNTSLRDVTTVHGKSPTVTSVDELTNKFVTPLPFYPFKRALGIPIAPKHVIEPLIKGAGGRQAFFRLWSQAEIAKNPKSLVTSGPFVVDRVVPAQRVEFKRADNYYCVDPAGKRLPYIDRLIFSVVPDVNTLLLKFKGKECDITQLRAKDVPALLKDQEPLNFKIFNVGQSTGTYFMMFNLNQRKNPKGKPFVDPVKSAWFNDVNFRQAINHVVNRKAIVDNYFKGIGYQLFTCEPPVSTCFNAQLKPFPQDVDYSMKLLEQSGFKKNKDGNLVDKTGHRVEFDMLGAAGGTFIEAASAIIKNDLEKLGIKANVALIQGNSLMSKVDGSRDWDCVIYALSGDPLDPNNGANVFKTAGRLHLFDERTSDDDPKPEITDKRPWEARIDELFDAGVTEFDPAKRKAIYDEYQKIVYDEAPFIYLVSPMALIGVRNTINNYSPTPLSQLTYGLHNIDEIYMTKPAAAK